MTDQTPAPLLEPGQTADPAGQASASQTSPPAATGGGQGQVSQTTSAVSRPTWIPESFWDAEKSAPKEKEFSEHLASLEKLKADTEAKRGAIPAKPEDYKPDLGDIKLPPGRELDTKDPRFVALQKVAHDEGLTPATFNKLLAIEANSVIESATRAEAGREERNKMLGENGAARVEALSSWIDAQFIDAKEAAQVKATMWTPVIVKFFEKIQKAATGQGLHGFVQTGREQAQDDGKPDGWDKLSAVDRRTWQLQENRRKAS
jgi:hypothetical protein